MNMEQLSNFPAAARQLMGGSRVWEKYGMTLSSGQALLLAQRQADALRASGRVDFGGGILKKLADAFCDSPYLQPADWCGTLAQLTGLFYELKNETRDRLGDDALIAAMAARFNGEAGGSPEALADTEPAWFLRFAAEGGFL